MKTYNCEAGQACVQIEAASHEAAEEIARPKLREILLPHLSPESNEWPAELYVTEAGSQECKCWSFLEGGPVYWMVKTPESDCDCDPKS